MVLSFDQGILNLRQKGPIRGQASITPIKLLLLVSLLEILISKITCVTARLK